MSNPRVALICEGVTDKIVIEAALKSILATPFILTMLQPEVELGGGFSPTGGGWGGVYRWCRQIVSMGQGIASNVSLTHFDAIIIHIDADVATKNYAEARIQDPPHDDLPCNQPCPPAEDTVNPLRKIITGWLGASDASDLPYNWILCIPSRKTEAWIIVALFHQLQPLLLSNIECNDEVEHFLANQSAESRLIRYKDGKFKKEISIYQAKSEIITRDGNVPIWWNLDKSQLLIGLIAVCIVGLVYSRNNSLATWKCSFVSTQIILTAPTPLWSRFAFCSGDFTECLSDDRQSAFND